LVRQYRYAAGAHTLELPAGKKEHRGEDGLARAQAELAEETGYVSDHWVACGSVMGAIGYGNEVVDLYAAFACRLNGQGQRLDDEEFVEVITLPAPTVEAMIHRDEIIDGKTIIGFLKAQKKLSEFMGKVL
jgi:ADP-ribose pyrophosphatase